MVFSYKNAEMYIKLKYFKYWTFWLKWVTGLPENIPIQQKAWLLYCIKLNILLYETTYHFVEWGSPLLTNDLHASRIKGASYDKQIDRHFICFF